MTKLMISIIGAGGTGKSTTAVEIGKALEGRSDTRVISWIEDSNGVDIYAELEINEKKIVILSQGDPSSGMEQALDRAVKNGFDIIVCTCRLYGSTTASVQQHLNEYDIYWLRSDVYSASHTDNVSIRNRDLGINLIKSHLNTVAQPD